MRNVHAAITGYLKRRRDARERHLALKKFKLIGRMSVKLKSSILGRYMGESQEHLYFYQNGYGERKVEATDDFLLEQPAAVYFLAGKPLEGVLEVVR